MVRKQSQSESRDKDAADASNPLTEAEAKEAMTRFESLARRLLAVTQKELQEEQKRFMLPERKP
jgi:hypothetical protein